MRSLDDLRDVSVCAAQAAAAVAVGWATGGQVLELEAKGPGDYVTAADRAAEAAAIAIIQSATPEIVVLAEESGGVVAERMWVIDPIDGTTNFARGFPEVGVSVALVEAGEPVVGAVAAPFHGAVWSAIRGGGARRESDGRRLAVHDSAGRGVVTTGMPLRVRRDLPRYLPVFEGAVHAFEDFRRTGCASLDLTYTAVGCWDGYFELGLSLWDFAAGALLVTEAGGRVTDWVGDRRDVYGSGDIVAGAPAWHERMLDVIRNVAIPAERVP